MGLLNGVINRFRVSTTVMKNIVQLLGSFKANKLFDGKGTYLKEAYGENIDVYSIVSRLMNMSSAVPIIVEKKTSEGWEMVPEGSKYHKILKNPNKSKGYTITDIDQLWTLYYLVSGNGLLYGIPSSSGVSQLDVLPWQHIDLETNEDFLDPVVTYIMTFQGRPMRFEQEEIAHLRFHNPSFDTVEEMFCGLSPIQSAAMAVQVGNDRWDATANIYQNRGAIGLISDQTGKNVGGGRPLTPDEAEKLQGAFDRDNSGTHNFGKVRVTNKDLRYIQIAMSPQDLQLIEHGQVNLRALCNVYGVPSEVFNDPDNKTYNTRKEAEKAIFTNAIIPMNNKKMHAFNKLVLGDEENIRYRYDYSGVEALQTDFHQEAKTYTMLRNSGIITAKTAAQKLEIEIPETENADKLITANNNILLETLGAKKANENEILEIIRSLSPLTANRLIDNLDSNEVRNLLGLAPKPEQDETGQETNTNE